MYVVFNPLSSSILPPRPSSSNVPLEVTCCIAQQQHLTVELESVSKTRSWPTYVTVNALFVTDTHGATGASSATHSPTNQERPLLRNSSASSSLIVIGGGACTMAPPPRWGGRGESMVSFVSQKSPPPFFVVCPLLLKIILEERRLLKTLNPTSKKMRFDETFCPSFFKVFCRCPVKKKRGLGGFQKDHML